ncbi:hypothetical protein PG996_012518 [Apiospora saccharicola]|uniref:Rhodopsin domain-containing protein n=1 Tax=Apiospora saccharicola TaxID=335842 RepID=A0ABR1U2T3_9PEZI
MDIDLSQIPALEPPPGSGIVPNFVDPVSIAPICLVVIAVTLPLMVIFIALRVYVRQFMAHAVGADDILNNPVGPHQWDVPAVNVTALFQKLTVVSVVIYALGCMAVKSTLLVLYLRIFSLQPNAKRLIWSGLIFIVVFYLISFIVTLASCLPRPGEDGWSSINPARGNRCWEEDSRFAEVQGIFGALTDLYVWIVPMTMVAKVRLSRKRKLGVYGVFLTGFLACVVSIINAAFRFEMFQSSDALWNEGDSAAELNIGIICACMPVVFTLFRGLARRLLDWITKLRASGKPQHKEGSEMPPFAEVEAGNGRLPPIPQGTLSGLKRFVRRTHRSRATDTSNTALTTTAQGDFSLVSADYNYHAYLDRPRLDT